MLSQLANITGELELQGKANANSQSAQVDVLAHQGHAQKDVTHHYKITSTQTLEIDDSQLAKAETGDEVKESKAKRKGCGCFSMCFGKKA